jgi:hypothetical protein
MMDPATTLPPALRRLVASRPPRPAAVERCEFCSEEIPAAHGHVASLAARGLLCVCRACYLLFVTRGAAGGHYRSVPDRYEALPGARLDSVVWAALQIPVGLACIFVSSSAGRAVALYPSPAGATESLLRLDAWPDLVAAEPRLASMDEDVEALLVRHGDSGPQRTDGGRPREHGAIECYIVPIDACYELVGRLRRSWRGFQGGDEAWRDVDQFFARVRERSGGGQ